MLGRSRTGLGLLAAGVLLASAGVTAAGAAAAAATTCATTPSTVVPGIQITDPGCGFTPLAGSTVSAGVLHGSAYRIEVPAHWNRTLVMFAHGFNGTGTVVKVDNPQLRSYFIAHGYAWAASSYRKNGYNVGDGVLDTHDLLVNFPALSHHAKPRAVYMSGLSMGGEITAVEIEHYRRQFVGAMPYCGVLGANHLFDYYLGANATAAALTKTPIRYPLTAADGAAYTPSYDQTVQQELPKLGISTDAGSLSFTTHLTPTGAQWSRAVEQLSGGTRPGFTGALAFWNGFGFPPLTNIPFLFGLYPGLSGGTIGYANGNVAGNIHTTYQLDNNPALTAAERSLNRTVLRVHPTNTPTTDPARSELPNITGDPRIPVLSLHDIGDLFVPLKMDQLYARQLASHHQSRLFTDRVIRGTGHCEFTDHELASGFTDLVNWVRTGHQAAGDQILNRKAVARTTFGCRFTDPTKGAHIFFGPTCPPARHH